MGNAPVARGIRALGKGGKPGQQLRQNCFGGKIRKAAAVPIVTGVAVTGLAVKPLRDCAMFGRGVGPAGAGGAEDGEGWGAHGYGHVPRRGAVAQMQDGAFDASRGFP